MLRGRLRLLPLKACLKAMRVGLAVNLQLQSDLCSFTAHSDDLVIVLQLVLTRTSVIRFPNGQT